MPIFGDKAYPRITDEKFSLLERYASGAEGQPIPLTTFDPKPEDPKVVAERERLRHVDLNPRPRPPIEDPVADPEPVNALSDRIGRDGDDQGGEGDSRWQPGVELRSLAQRLQNEAEALPLNLSEETVEPASDNDVVSGIALGGLISGLAGRARRKTVSPLAKAVSQISLKEPYGKAKESVRARYEQLKARTDSKDHSENQLVTTEPSESRPEKVVSLPVSAARLVWGGFKKRLESAPRLSRPDIDIAKYAKIGAIPLYATRNLSSKSYEAAKSLAKDEKHHETRRKLAIGAVAGSLALAAAAVSIYAVNKAGHSPQSSQEAINHTPAQHTKFPEFSLPLPLQIAKVHATHHAHTAIKHFHYQKAHLSFTGDTIWYHAQSKLQAALGHKPTGPELVNYVQRTLKLNHLNWDSARHMVRGQTFKLPFVDR